MKFATYDEAYLALGVLPGADYFEVKRAWRYLVKYQHPDIFTNPRLRDEATEKFKRYNAAYDKLRTYWEMNQSMPPVTKTGADSTWTGSSSKHSQAAGSESPAGARNNAASGSSDGASAPHKDASRRNRGASDGADGQPSPGSAPGNGKSSHTGDTDTKYGANDSRGQDDEEFWRKFDEEHPPLKEGESVSFGPPPMQRNFIHALFDGLDRIEHDVDTVWLAFLIYTGSLAFVICAAMSLVVTVFNLLGLQRAQAADTLPGSVLLLASLGTVTYLFYGAWYYYYQTYKMLQHPFVEMSYSASRDVLLHKVREALCNYKYKNFDWKLGRLEEDGNSCWTVIGTMDDTTAQGNLRNSLKVTVKLWQRSDDITAVTFWFEEKGQWFKPLAANVLGQTNACLRNALGVAHPNYRKPSPAEK